MINKLRFFWEELNASFWFLPILMLAFSIGSAIGLIYLDDLFQQSPGGVWAYILPGSVEAARSILTIIAGAMIGIAGTVFSITLVVLTLASSQLGSRLVRKFMYDKLNQIVLGTYVSSFVYCLIVLSTLAENEHHQFVPAFSVLVALASALAGIVLLIVFIHHVSMSIQSDKVISDISETMSKSIRRLFPEEIGHEEENPAPDINLLKQTYSFKEAIKSRKSGYLQSVGGEGLMNSAKENDCLIILHNRPGDFIVQDLQVCEVLCNEKLGSEVYEKIHDDLIIGKIRTPLQDAEFSIHQMVEVASRALSPGVNDPYTAIACIDNLTSVMCYLAGVKFPSPYRYDEDNKLRVIADNHSFPGMLNAAFNQIRQYAEGNPSVIIRLIEALITIYKFARNNNQKNHILQHANMVMQSAERSFKEKRDLEDIRERFTIFNDEDKMS